MARNGAGVYSIVNTLVAGTTITAAGHNQNYADIGAELTNSVAVDGQSTMTGPLKASNGTAAAPSHSFGSDLDTGGYRSAANKYSVAAGGVQVTEVSSAGIDVKTGTVLLAGVAAFPVPTAQIAADAVTYAKIQNVAAVSLLGNPTGSAADVSEITLGAGLSFSGTTIVPTVSPALIANYLSGLTLSTAGSSATFGIAVGVANDTTNVSLMQLASAYTKTTSAWALGTAAGALDTGTIANSTWYHVFLIKRVDTGVVDVLISTSVSSPTMPTNYTLKRRIGSMKTNGSAQWTKFSQDDDTFILDAAVTIAASTYGTGSRSTLTSAAPTGVVVTALLRAIMNNGGTGGTGLIISSLLESDQAATAGGYDLITISGGYQAVDVERLTNTSAQFGIRPTNASDTFTFWTYGWKDTRGK